MQVTTYFVLKGLQNGEEGVRALITGVGEQQEDGWYWITDGMDDGIGPFHSKEAAIRDAEDTVIKWWMIARGAIEQGLTEEACNGSADGLYDEACNLAHDALCEAAVSTQAVRSQIAQEVAQTYAQP